MPDVTSDDPTSTSWVTPNLFAGKSALVTGGGAGIGRSIARNLAALGARVGVLDLGMREAKETVGLIAEASGLATAFGVDVTSEDEVKSAVDTFAAAGGIDLVVNCAGVMLEGALDQIELERWRRTFAVNLDGPLLVARAALAALKVSASPAVVNIGSIASVANYPGGGAYGPSKTALATLTAQMAVEWAEHGIRVNAVSPGPTTTALYYAAQTPESTARRLAQTPLHRLSSPQNIADAVLFLLTPQAWTITGQNLFVDGGISQTLWDGPASWSSRGDR